MMPRHTVPTLLTLLASTMAGCSTGAGLSGSDPYEESSSGEGEDEDQDEEGPQDDGRDTFDRPDSPPGDPCEDGLETCPCTDDEDCAPGLACDSGACWPLLGICGDGLLDEEEECDDGPDNSNDGWCKSDCTMQVCGDGEVGPGEACDDGNEIDDDGCTTLCTTSGCGNGEVDGAEECDDGNASDDDGCTQTCMCQLSFGEPMLIDQWALTGDWAIYEEAPTSDLPAVPFMTQALGTDGNRAAPYPGTEAEVSSATTSSFTLPQTLRFRSWHVDEGGNSLFDQKRVLVSTDDGATWSTLLDCAEGPHGDLPLCQAEQGPRDAAAWDDVELDLAEHAGMVGMLRFEYETADECCGFEQGWFIDDINALECA